MVQLILFLALIGYLTYLITTKIPMREEFKTAIVIIVIVALIIFLMNVFGISDIPVPKLR